MQGDACRGEAGRRGARRCWNIPGREPAGGPVARARARLRGFAAGPHSGPAPPSCGLAEGTRVAAGTAGRAKDRKTLCDRDSGRLRGGSPGPAPPGAAAGGRGRARAPCTWSTSGAPQRAETPPESQPARRLIFHLPTLSSFYSQMTFSIKKCKFPQETFVVSFLTSHPSLMRISS